MGIPVENIFSHSKYQKYYYDNTIPLAFEIKNIDSHVFYLVNEAMAV